MKRTALCSLVVTLAAVAPTAALAGLTSVAAAAETAAPTTAPGVTEPAAPPTTTDPTTVAPTPTPTTGPTTPTTPTTTTAATPSEPTIDVVTINGSGCPISTAEIEMSPDHRTFRVLYGSYTAQAGAGVAATESRKNCQLNLKVSPPKGYTIAVDKTDLSGYLDLAAGASAVTRTNYYFQGMANNASSTRTINGPVSGDWQTTDVVALSSLVWMPCDTQRNLNVNTELRVNKGSSTRPSSITLEEIGFMHFSWARC